MNDIVIYGAGGFGGEVACLLQSINEKKAQWNLIGFIDDVKQSGYNNKFGEVIGNFEYLNSYKNSLSVVISIGTPQAVAAIVKRINNPNIKFPNIYAPDLIMMDAKSFKAGIGNLLMFQSLISFGVTIGDFNLFNAGSSLGHGVSMGSYNSFMSYSKISGDVTIGNRNYFGLCSTVLQRIQIGNDNIIGVNSVLLRDAKDSATYFGNPAKEIPKPIRNSNT